MSAISGFHNNSSIHDNSMNCFSLKCFCDFLLASKKGVYSKRKEFAPIGANSSLEELTIIEKGRNKMKTEGVASPESVLVFLHPYFGLFV